MADAADSKSAEGNLMRVRPSPPAEISRQGNFSLFTIYYLPPSREICRIENSKRVKA